MTRLSVIGAGVGRTGTTSLKLALEQLLGGRCYHMLEAFWRPDHIHVWQQAARGTLPDWEGLFAGFVATTDWPAAAFWRELTDVYPDALVILSVRGTSDEWFASANATLGRFLRQKPLPHIEAWDAMVKEVLTSRFTAVPFEASAARAAYERHNAAVRKAVPKARLLEWQPADGWAPLCQRLGVPIPEDPFPHANKRDQFVRYARIGREESGKEGAAPAR